MSNTTHTVGKENRYVCGFFFDKEVNNVVLIWKEKPAWQKGKLNGVGGKIEAGEMPLQSMIREFEEETGLYVTNWKELIVLSGEDWEVVFFYAVDESNQFEYAETKELEEVAKIEVDRLGDFAFISNLGWLVPMAAYLLDSPKENHSMSQSQNQPQ